MEPSATDRRDLEQASDPAEAAPKHGRKIPKEARALFIVVAIGLFITIMQFLIVEKLDSKVYTLPLSIVFCGPACLCKISAGLYILFFCYRLFSC
jgi:hypothetical protein